MKTFEDFLEQYFIDLDEVDGMPITKDNCESMFEGWLENRDTQEIIDLANKAIVYYKEQLLNELRTN